MIDMIEKMISPDVFEVKKKHSRDEIEELLLGLFSAATKDSEGKIPSTEPLEPIKMALDAKGSDYLYGYIMEALVKDPALKDSPDVLYAAKRLSLIE